MSERARFALRIGRRYSRKPLPSRYVVHVQSPLQELIEAEYLEKTAQFTEWLILEQDEKEAMPILIGVIDDDADMVTAENTFFEIIDKLDEPAREHIDTERSRVEKRNELRFGQYLDSYPVDLEEATYAADMKRKKDANAGRESTAPKHNPPSLQR